MHRRTWLKYFAYIVSLVLLIFLKEYVNGLIKGNFAQTFRVNLYYLAAAALVNIGIGIFLGLEHLISEIKKTGTWKVNVPKIILMGLPSLYFSMVNFIIYGNIEFLRKALVEPFWDFFFKFGTNYAPVFQIILGFVIITGFYKHNGS
ncbi:MAG: hypothetical protein GXW85_12320 [Clostridia bacterium]|nr:hypothetical protein [Clostridia bacterium]